MIRSKGEGYRSDDFDNLGELEYGEYDYGDYPSERQWVRWWYVNDLWYYM